MNRLTASLTFVLVLAHYSIAGAISTYAYRLLQESSFLLLSVGCLILALAIFSALKGGSLGTPWVFFMTGFALAAIGAAIHLLDLFRIFVHVYDLRPVTLLTTSGSILFLFLGLFFYRKGLG